MIVPWRKYEVRTRVASPIVTTENSERTHTIETGGETCGVSGFNVRGVADIHREVMCTGRAVLLLSGLGSQPVLWWVEIRRVGGEWMVYQ